MPLRPRKAPGSFSSDVNIEHDALYRVTRSTYSYLESGVGWGSDVALDWRDERTRVNADTSTHESVDPMRERPAPMEAVKPPNRGEELNWSYDWLANMTSWTDDAESFYERSIGMIENGSQDPTLRPSALYLSYNAGGTAADGGGWIEVDYGVSGNVETMTVHGQCADAPGVTCEVPHATVRPLRMYRYGFRSRSCHGGGARQSGTLAFAFAFTVRRSHLECGVSSRGWVGAWW